MSEIPVVELRGVSVRGGTAVVLDAISLAFPKGAATFIMGPAGSGKSSLIKVAAGITIPTEGEVLVEGRECSSLGKREMLEFRKRSGFVFQDAALWANQSLFDNIAFPLRFHDPKMSAVEVQRAVARATELAGCRRDLSVRPADISAGEARAIGLARALALDPDILFFDDPLGDLDDAGRERLGALLADLRARGRTILVTGATPELARKLADRVAVIRDGRLTADGSYDEAVRWRDPAALGLPGRLPARSARDGLVGAWEDALAGDGFGGPDAPAGPGAEES